jgi:hypothetical protein
MNALLDLALGELGPWLIGGLLALGGLVMAFLKGGARAKTKAEVKGLKGFKKTTERMQDADAAMGDDPAALREWLRQRDPDQR